MVNWSWPNSNVRITSSKGSLVHIIWKNKTMHFMCELPIIERTKRLLLWPSCSLLFTFWQYSNFSLLNSSFHLSSKTSVEKFLYIFITMWSGKSHLTTFIIFREQISQKRILKLVYGVNLTKKKNVNL